MFLTLTNGVKACMYVKNKHVVEAKKKNTSVNANRWKSERGDATLQLAKTHRLSQTHEKRCYALAEVTRDPSRNSLTCAWNPMEATGLFRCCARSLHVTLWNAEAQS